MYEYVGNIHFHTTASDGTATIEEAVAAAERVGLDFIIPTDHNVYLPGLDGWYGKVLLLVGEEVHDPAAEHPGNHYLVFDAEEEMSQFASDPQVLIDEVRLRGGFGFLAHPFERAAERFGEHAIPWRDWQVTGYAGISIWNYMSEFKAHLTSVPAALRAAYFPQCMIRGPFPETLAKWDELLQTRRMPAIGTSDAHGITYKLGPLRRQLFPYEYLFRTVNYHALSEKPFTGELDHDKRIVYGAMQGGRGFIAYDLLGDARGFHVTARAGDQEVGVGGTVSLTSDVLFEISSPIKARLRVILNGEMVDWAYTTRMRHRTRLGGVYRIEAQRLIGLRWRNWVYTNPIYVE